MLTSFLLLLVFAAILALLCIVCTLQIRNTELQSELEKSQHNEMTLRSENACLDHRVLILQDENDRLALKISSMTGRTRDARGRFVPSERAAEVAQAVKKLDVLLETGVVTRGVPANLKS